MSMMMVVMMMIVIIMMMMISYSLNLNCLFLFNLFANAVVVL